MIVVDTSAILAVIQREPEHERLRRAIGDVGMALVSAGTVVEPAVVSNRSRHFRTEVTRFLRAPFVRIEPVTASPAASAAAAFRSWGKGHHPAALNLGDMFAYLLARRRDLALLFKGNDFARTDVRNALEEGSA